jgi:hypothetical protein
MPETYRRGLINRRRRRGLDGPIEPSTRGEGSMKKTEDRPHALALTHEKICPGGAGQVGTTAQGNHPGTPGRPGNRALVLGRRESGCTVAWITWPSGECRSILAHRRKPVCIFCDGPRFSPGRRQLVRQQFSGSRCPNTVSVSISAIPSPISSSAILDLARGRARDARIRARLDDDRRRLCQAHRFPLPRRPRVRARRARHRCGRAG